MQLMKHTIAAAALAALSAGAFAGSSVSSSIPAGSVLLSDDSAERWIDSNSNGILDVGDKLRGILTVNQSGPPTTLIGGNTGYNELTGIFQTIVTAVNPASPGRSDFVFSSDPAFAAEFGVANGTIGIFFEDSKNNFKRQGCGAGNTPGTFAQCEATVTDGESIWASFGVAGGFWTAGNSANNPAVGAGLPLATPIGQFGLGLNFIINNTGFQWNKVQCVDTTTFSLYLVDLCGNGGISATGRNNVSNLTNTPYDLFDDVNFTANRVPEPASVALVGLALIGMGAAVRRSKK